MKEIWIEEYHKRLDEIAAQFNLDWIEAYHYFNTHDAETELVNDRTRERISDAIR